MAQSYKTISVDVGVIYVEIGVRNLCSRNNHWPVRVRETVFKCCLVRRGNQRIMLLQVFYDQTAVEDQLRVYHRIQCSIWSRKTIENALITVAGFVSELNWTGYCRLRYKTISFHWKVHVVLDLVNGCTFNVIRLRPYFQLWLKLFNIFQNVVFTTRW